VQAALTVAATTALGVATGILSRDTASGGTTGFGVFSLNLASPFVPQLSGVFPPLAGYWTGMRSQVLGWPGTGVWLVVLAAVVLAGARPPIRRHAALAAVLLAFVLFALSDRVTLGARVLLDVPLPEKLAYALGAFRASGRFVWPATFAALAWGLLTLLRRKQGFSLVVLAAAALLQVIDAGPLRAAIAESASHPLAPIFDRARAASIVGAARELAVFPSSGCIAATDPSQEARLNQANVELQLLASEKNLPLNSVVNSRLPTDCAAEARDRQAPLRPGVAYFYLAGLPPETDGAVCAVLDWLLACRVP
jgi:hypothetical protein